MLRENQEISDTRWNVYTILLASLNQAVMQSKIRLKSKMSKLEVSLLRNIFPTTDSPPQFPQQDTFLTPKRGTVYTLL